MVRAQLTFNPQTKRCPETPYKWELDLEEVEGNGRAVPGRWRGGG